ncbi:RNA polymerase II transcription factor SIII subunit A-domain-containing protein [Lipomyces kononenkoae]|uniref:RNA polymerase II transcription factor SIII subunit A-domain-containing protein n=1 Tax=Lipomyces kononenkoae TaxID=34357 RepID=A0ACC3ST76_LIPKO
MSNQQHDAEEVEEPTTTIGELSSGEKEALPGIHSSHIEPDGPMSLFQICLQTCMRHTNRIVDVGDIPYDIIKPVLSGMAPSQLIAIEEKSPHIKPETDELWEGFIRHTFREQEIQQSKVRKIGDVRKQYYMLLEARRLRLKKTSERVKAQYDALEREKAQKRIVTLDVFEDPMEAQRRKKRLLQQSSAASLKKMSVVKRARMESMSNPIFSSDNIKITSTAARTTEPMSHEEADRRRQEKLNQRIAERNQHLKSRDMSSSAPAAVLATPLSANGPRDKSGQSRVSEPKLSFFESLSPHKTTLQLQSTSRETRQVASLLLPSKMFQKKA